MVFCHAIFAQRNINANVIDQQGDPWNQIKAYLYLEESGTAVKNLVDSTEIIDGKLEFKNVILTGISDIVGFDDFDDFSNYPNPFSQTTNFTYFSNGTDPVTITIYDMLGRMIDKVENGITAKGKNSLIWSDKSLNNGVYIAKFINGQNTKSIRIIKDKNTSSYGGYMVMKSAKSFVPENTNATIEIRGEEAYPYTLGFDITPEGEINLGNITVSRKGIFNEDITLNNLTTLFNLHKEAGVVYRDTLSATGDTLRALDALGQWIVYQPEVAEAYYVGLNLVEIYLNNGLRTDIMIIPVDADGQHLIRGGGSGSTSLKKFLGIQETQPIDNPGVLVLIPYFQEFYYSHWDKKSLFEGGSSDAPKPSDVNLITGTDVTLAELELMDDAGFIILNTHGVSDGFLLKMNDNGFDLADTSKFSKADIQDFIIANNNLPLDLLANGELRISTQFNHDIISKRIVGIDASLTVTEEYVRNMGINLSNSVLFANHCYSGWVADGNTENNMSQAWLSKGLSTYYGYAYENGGSAAVGNDFSKIMEDSLIVNLVQNTDSTGEAHLAPNGSFQFELFTKRIRRREVEKKKLLATMTVKSESPYIEVNTPLYFYHYFQDNYSYEDCGEDLVDPRDSMVYKTVCIGDLVWMAENLAYLPKVSPPSEGSYHVYGYNGTSVSEAKATDNYTTYGVLYNWSVAKAACPPGWHLPTDDEWKQLEMAIGMSQSEADDSGGRGTNEGTKLKATSGWNNNGNGTDDFGFSALPGGHRSTNGYFNYLGNYGYWWSATDVGSHAWHRLMNFSAPIVARSGNDKENGFSIRCVRD